VYFVIIMHLLTQMQFSKLICYEYLQLFYERA
jgi:hypothetical protein